MNVVQGKNILLDLNGSLLACATDIDISFSNSFLPTRNVNSVGWKTQIQDESQFTISGSGLVIFAGRKAWYDNGFETPVLISFKYHSDNDEGQGYWSGNGWISTYGESSSGSGFATYSFEIVGDGKPTFVQSTGIGSMSIETGSPIFKIR